MVNIPIRDFAKFGIVTDVESYDLPLQSFSYGSNIRVGAGKIERGNVFRKVANLASDVNGLCAFADGAGTYRLFYSATDGKIYERASTGTVTDRSPATGTAGVSPGAVNTIARLNGVLYWNRSDQTPFYIAETSSGNFARLDQFVGDGKGALNGNYRFRAMREFNGMLVGLNVTQAGANDPRKVMWSDYATTKDSPPPNWAIGDPISRSRSNSIAQFDGYLIDAHRLGQSLILYGNKEVWEMSPNGLDTVFNFRHLFAGGVINVNCVVTAQSNRNFVFGTDDLYMHDSSSAVSLADGTVRNFVFQGLVRAESHRCFVVWNPRQSEVVFCYVSNDPFVKFRYGAPYNNVGCNRAAIYNYSTKLWCFADLPYVTAATFVPITKVRTIDEMTDPIDSYGGSNDAALTGQVESFVFAGSAATLPVPLDRSLRTWEPPNSGATTLLIDMAATAPAILVKEKVDLDELKASLRGYKVLNGITPQISLSPDALPITISVGSSDTPNEPTVWLESQTFGHGDYKCDFNTPGRYLALKIESDDFRHWTLSGMDVDLIATGTR